MICGRDGVGFGLVFATAIGVDRVARKSVDL
jgi:hypothetical protein